VLSVPGLEQVLALGQEQVQAQVLGQVPDSR